MVEKSLITYSVLLSFVTVAALFVAFSAKKDVDFYRSMYLNEKDRRVEVQDISLCNAVYPILKRDETIKADYLRELCGRLDAKRGY